MSRKKKDRERNAQFQAARRAARPGAAGAARPAASDETPRCGLCGKTKNLTRTECCGNWICDDEDKYVMFSYARNSCYRNHRRYTLCAGHFAEGHAGDWKTCRQCREMMETEMYVYHGTNEYNFEKLPNPPKFEPTRCATCGRVIVLSQGGYSYSSKGHQCGRCVERELGQKLF